MKTFLEHDDFIDAARSISLAARIETLEELERHFTEQGKHTITDVMGKLRSSLDAARKEAGE